ncbi:aminotransferase class IV [Trinickia caryophylli]|uniref:branched-chain-amino-acid transaminase n=1 Tax=Trinickia caryophylli TaxID=28094 RepID=A0A1X7FKA2_TRICW|nr:aminotransferase class IV [Trinickia caryophylli]PMS13190.1 branched chain amino acid aminotransferase [Trinickia caryophylli]TRX19284.1 branched chain amino acid aminotransferase [Trinickia caryophylli]WQE13413.1 aminotransferase class IV [Trinickia caryophylli]SMF53252.1 branched-chain amino acid aminotransferase [Trinickia caryophylli]GLU34064.1 branched-chain-amino-acid aminotransferase [Trinickia caryophylli]
MKWWLDGKLIPADTLSVPINTYSLHYGLCVFEGIRSYSLEGGRTIFRLEEHIARFVASAEMLGSPITGYRAGELCDAVMAVAETAPANDLYIRPLYYVGNGIMGLRATPLDQHVAVTAWQWQTDRSHPRYTSGIKVVISRHTRRKDYAQAKVSGNYLASVAAVNSIPAGFDEAILLDEDGYLCEATAQNVFVVLRDTLHTPRVKSCLNGITRNAVIEVARKLGLGVHERDITPAELLAADEAFLTSTASEVLPIAQVESHRLGSAAPDSCTSRIRQTFLDLVQSH